MSSLTNIPTESYSVQLKTFFKPAIQDRGIELDKNGFYDLDDDYNEYPNFGSYSELELKLLISRISVEVSRIVRNVSVHFDRNIKSRKVNSYMIIYIKSEGKVVIPYDGDIDKLNLELPSGFVHSKDAVQIGSEPLTMKRFKRLVHRCESTNREYGVVAGHMITSDIGVIPDWWIQSTIKNINLRWLESRIGDHPRYDYKKPELVRSRHSLLLKMDSPTYLNDEYYKITGIVDDILIGLYRRGSISYQVDGTTLHPSGLYVLNWTHPLIIDKTKFIERIRSYGKGYVPVAGYLVGTINESDSQALISYGKRFVITEGDKDSTLEQLNSL
jgi:hypothetical protein